MTTSGRLRGSRASNGKPQGTGPEGQITRDDIAAKLRSLSGGPVSATDVSERLGTWAIAAAVGVAVVGAYILGRRKGRKGRAVIEIRRS